MGKLSASSIVEVTTAVIILSIVFGIAVFIVINLTASGTTLQKTKYALKLKEIAQTTQREKTYFSEQFDDGPIRIFKQVEAHPEIPTLIVIKLRAVSSNGNILATYNSLFYAPERQIP